MLLAAQLLSDLQAASNKSATIRGGLVQLTHTRMLESVKSQVVKSIKHLQVYTVPTGT